MTLSGYKTWPRRRDIEGFARRPRRPQPRMIVGSAPNAQREGRCAGPRLQLFSDNQALEALEGLESCMEGFGDSLHP